MIIYYKPKGLSKLSVYCTILDLGFSSIKFLLYPINEDFQDQNT